MITNIQPTYQVSDKEYNFSVTVHDIKEAVRINNNLLKSIYFIRTLKKYHSFDNTYSSSNVKRFETGRFRFNNDGTIADLFSYSSETHYDDWEGRPPITHSFEEIITISEIIDKTVPDIIRKIEDAISKLKYIKNMSNNNVFNSIIDEWNIDEKIQKLNDDITILRYN